MKHKTLEPKFVKFMPAVIEEGILYISIPYSTVIHRCACGCGEKVVTTISPTDWSITWNGKSVTMYPSIGSWSLPCRSHYFITENRIVWAGRWGMSRIRANRALDKATKDQYYEKLRRQTDSE